MDVSSNAQVRPDHAPADRAEGGCVAVEAHAASRAGQLGELLESAIQPFVAADFEGLVTHANRAFAGLAARPVNDLIGRHLGDVTPPELRDNLIRALAKIRLTASSLRFEGQCLRGDGQIIPIDVAAEPDRDADGRMVGFYAFVTDLSDRKLTADALRVSEERFRKLYDKAPVGYHEVDTEGRIVNINLTECEMLGYPREELLGRPVFDFLAEENREAARRGFPEKVSGKIPLRPIERIIVTRDGRRLDVAIEERFKRDDEGRVVGILSTLQDISDRKHAEKALVQSERRSRALFEGIEDAVFVHALGGQILDANPAASVLLGYSRDELLTMSTGDVDDDAFATGFEDRLSRQLALGHLACEGRHRTKDGRVIPVEIKTSTILFDDQKAVMAVIRDISERLALEQTRKAFAESQAESAREIAAKNAELTVSEERYRQLTEGCLDGVIAADSLGFISLFNPAAERMFGFTEHEIVGQPLPKIIPGVFDELGATERLCEEMFRDSETGLVGKTMELTGRRKEGVDFPLEISLSCVESGGALQLIGSIRDQTERQRMRDVLARTEKLASIGLLSAGVAHEINNPLAYVGNNVAVLERDLANVLEMIALYEQTLPTLDSNCGPTAEHIRRLAEEFDWEYVRENLPRMLSRTREGVQRVANIVSNLRGLARTTPPKMEPAHLPDIVESAMEMVRGRLRRQHIELTVTYGEIVPLVCMGTQISQVVLNLVVNAAQAIETAGRSEGGRIDVAVAKQRGSVVIGITDNGGGISPDSMPHLFDPFFTTKSVGEGTGLGLFICHGIITGHGGRIDVENHPGKGSTFRVILPIKTS